MSLPGWSFVTVQWTGDAAPGLLQKQSDASLCVHTAHGSAKGLLLARTGPAGPHDGDVLDVHLAVNADMCREVALWQCADVLYGSRRRSFEEADSWFTDTMGSFPGCRVTAVPLIDGRWAASDDTGAAPVPLPCPARPDQWLIASCLHGLLVTGLSLREAATVCTAVRPEPWSQSADEHRWG